MSQRFDEKTRKGIIIDAAISVIKDAEHPATVSHKTVAQACSVVTSVSTVRAYYPTKKKLWMAAAAVDSEVMNKLKLHRMV